MRTGREKEEEGYEGTAGVYEHVFTQRIDTLSQAQNCSVNACERVQGCRRVTNVSFPRVATLLSVVVCCRRWL